METNFALEHKIHRHINSHVRSSVLRIEISVRAPVEVSQLWIVRWTESKYQCLTRTIHYHNTL